MFPELMLFRIAASLAVTAYLAWEDARTSFMNERLLYAFAAAGLLFDLLFPVSPLPEVLVVAVVVAALGFWLYKTGQFGGGDVLLFLGLHLWLPTSPFVPVQLPFVLSVFLASAAFASLFSTARYALKLRRFALDEKKKAVFALLSLVSLAVFLPPFSLPAKLFFYLLLASASFYLVFRDELLEKIIIQPVSLREIEDEDVLAVERLPQKDVERFHLERVLTTAALSKLKAYARSSRRRLMPVYKNLPRFGPYILAGLVVCLLVGDLIWFLLLSYSK